MDDSQTTTGEEGAAPSVFERLEADVNIKSFRRASDYRVADATLRDVSVSPDAIQFWLREAGQRGLEHRLTFPVGILRAMVSACDQAAAEAVVERVAEAATEAAVERILQDAPALNAELGRDSWDDAVKMEVRDRIVARLNRIDLG